MSGEYYYFCSQLPTLLPDGAPPFSLDEFDARVKSLLPENDADYITKCVYPPVRDIDAASDSAYGRFRSWCFALAGEIARIRTGADSNDAAAVVLPPETDMFSDIRDAVANAASAPNPLEREKRLDILKFRKLDDLDGLLNFSRESVVCYRMRLAILEKNRNFREDIGRESFEDAVRLIDENSAE